MPRVCKFRAGFTLTEVSIAMLFAVVMILGTLGFTYHSRLDVHEADLQNTSMRIASLLVNDWKAAGGGNSYDPTESFSNQFSISQSDVGPDGLENLLGRYDILIDENAFHVTLSHRDAVNDKPRVLNVVVAWVERSGVWDSADPRHFVKLSGYVP